MIINDAWIAFPCLITKSGKGSMLDGCKDPTNAIYKVGVGDNID